MKRKTADAPTFAAVLAWREAQTVEGVPPTVAEIAKNLGVSPEYVREAIREGQGRG